MTDKIKITGKQIKFLSKIEKALSQLQRELDYISNSQMKSCIARCKYVSDIHVTISQIKEAISQKNFLLLVPQVNEINVLIDDYNAAQTGATIKTKIKA